MNWTRQQMLYKERKYTQKEEEVYEENLPDENPTIANMEEIGETEPEESVRMRALRTPRNGAYLNALMKGDEMNAQDEEIVSRVQQKLEIKEDSKSDKKQTHLEKHKHTDKLIGILCKCYIHGCRVHTIDKFGRIIMHYGKGMKGCGIQDLDAMPERLKKGYQLFQSNPCACVEVYEQHMSVVDFNGKTKVTKE